MKEFDRLMKQMLAEKVQGVEPSEQMLVNIRREAEERRKETGFMKFNVKRMAAVAAVICALSVTCYGAMQLGSVVASSTPDIKTFAELEKAEKKLDFDAKYVETFAKLVYDIEGVGGWLSMDHYPLRRTKEDEFYLFDDWFTDIETTAVTAKKYGLKPHFFIQSMAFGGTISWWNDRTPTEEDIRLQIYAYLAYGAKGVSHFCYQSPKSNEFFERQSGLFDKGAPTERWFYAQKIHKELKPFEKELVNCSWEKCLRVDSTVADVNELFNCQNGNAFEEFATMQSVETTARCLVGAFKGTDGKESFMLVNVEDTSKKKTVAVALTLKKPTSFKIYKSGENFVESFVNASTITLGVGEGIFMIEE